VEPVKTAITGNNCIILKVLVADSTAPYIVALFDVEHLSYNFPSICCKVFFDVIYIHILISTAVRNFLRPGFNCFFSKKFTRKSLLNIS